MCVSSLFKPKIVILWLACNLTIIKFNINNFYLFSFAFLSTSILSTILCLQAITGIELFLEWELLHISGIKFSFVLIVDYIRIIFFSTVMLIAGRVFLYRSRYIISDGFGNRFIWLVFIFVVSICLLIFRPNVVSLLLG